MNAHRWLASSTLLTALILTTPAARAQTPEPAAATEAAVEEVAAAEATAEEVTEAVTTVEEAAAEAAVEEVVAVEAGAERTQASSEATDAPTHEKTCACKKEGLSIRAVAELGYLGVLSHKIQFDQAGTTIDYKAEGGQEVLFPVSRLSLELGLNAKHRLVFLYQPLRIETQNLLPRDLVISEATFAAGTPVRFLYSFPFWRASWLYDFWAGPERELAIGVSLQIRDATIDFESLDGLLLRSSRDVGPVPILKARWRQPLGKTFFVGAEADGFYAPISYINGSDNEVVGAILDASVRGGLALEGGATLFLNLRYLGGGAVGTSEPDGPGDGYVKNWLHFLTVTAGATYDLPVRL